MEVIITPDSEAMGKKAAELVANLLNEKPNAVLGLATGSTPLSLYKELVRMHREEGLDFSQVKTFNLDEYVGLKPDHPQSYHFFMHDNLFKHLNIPPDAIHVPSGTARNHAAFCHWYEDQIQAAGGIDLQVLGVGGDGHIAFNEPGSSLGSRTRLKTLTPETIRDNARFFGDESQVPRLAVTVGVGTILESRRCLLLATGEHKARAIRDTIEGPVTAQVTGSALQLHRDVVAVIDENAAHLLERREYYRQMEEAQTHLEAERSRRQQQG